MALVPGICTQCGATLSADNSKDCMICPYCGTPFIVEKAINNFHNTYNISNSIVNIYGTKENDFVIRAGVLEKYNGSDTMVTIPQNVVAIGKGAFKDCYGLREVTIPEGVVSIEEWAFTSCKALQKVSLPKSLKEIGFHAFEHCENLQEILLPDELDKLGVGAFNFCRNLKKIKCLILLFEDSGITSHFVLWDALTLFMCLYPMKVGYTHFMELHTIAIKKRCAPKSSRILL